MFCCVIYFHCKTIYKHGTGSNFYHTCNNLQRVSVNVKVTESLRLLQWDPVPDVYYRHILSQVELRLQQCPLTKSRCFFFMISFILYVKCGVFSVVWRHLVVLSSCRHRKVFFSHFHCCTAGIVLVSCPEFVKQRLQVNSSFLLTD